MRWDGFFKMVAEEEKRIREISIARISDLLQKESVWRFNEIGPVV